MRSIRRPELLLVALLMAACGGSSPTTALPPTGATPAASPLASPTAELSATPPPGAFGTACVNLQEVDCNRLRDIVIATLPADTPPISYVEVGPFACTVDPCPETVAARPSGRITIEHADGSAPTLLDVAVQAGEVTTRPAQEVFLVPVLPSSRRLFGPRATIELGHCGLLSGIDVDGSFWDPIGHLDMTHQDAINAASAEFTLTTPATATLVTANGLTLDLARHPGGKHLPTCM